jgi:hypothetical protein
MNAGNWQRDLLRIVLYSSGVVIAFLGVPTLVVVIVTVIQTASAMSFVRDMGRAMSEAFGGGTGGIGAAAWILILQPVVQIIAGILLARWSGWFARVVFPDQPAPRDA